MHPQQAKWDGKYADAAAPAPEQACRVLRENLHLLPARGDALDLACGLGANSLLLAHRGLRVSAWDISPVALAKLRQAAGELPITTDARDVEGEPPPAASFDVICVSRFLHRPLCPALVAALRPGGLLFYQTFCADKLGAGGPNNPDFLLRRNELLALFADLRLCYYREDGRSGDLARGARDEAFFVGQRA